MSHTSAIRRKTIKDIMKAKGHHKLVCLTAYTAPIAQMLDEHCDLLLVGDSVGMVLHGLPDTTAVTLDMMIMHGKAVMRGSQNALVVVDMPFGSFEESPQAAYRNALRVMQETGCQAVKLEYNSAAPETIRFLVDRGIPVVAHIACARSICMWKAATRLLAKTKKAARSSWNAQSRLLKLAHSVLSWKAPKTKLPARSLTMCQSQPSALAPL